MTSTVGTEDDTFRILSRPGIHEMVELYKEYKRGTYIPDEFYDTRKNIVFANRHGWDWVEFLVAAKQANLSTSF